MKLNCIVIDDEPVARKILKEFIGEIDYLSFAGEAENPLKALSVINNETDIIFLDVNMPKMTGIDFLKSLDTKAAVIMTTAYTEFAADAYGLDVLDYLVKPIAFDRFLKACNKAKERKESGNARQTQSPANDHFFVK